MNEHEHSLIERLIRSNLEQAESNNRLAIAITQLVAEIASDGDGDGDDRPTATYMDGTPR